MIAYFPVTPHDKHLVGGLVKAIGACPPGQNHSAVVAAGPACAKEAAELSGALDKHFFNVLRVNWDMDPPDGWPVGPNHVFRRAAQNMAERVPGAEPFFFFELDATPVKEGWLDALEGEYRRNGKEHMGVVAETIRFIDGKGTSHGDHMVGCGIYPHDLWAKSIIIRYLDSRDPFDVQLQYEIMHSRAHTDMIAHHFNTRNYKYAAGDPGGFTCEDVGDRELYGLTYGGPVSGRAFVVHGCKDGSLAELVSGAKPGAKAPKREVVEKLSVADK